MSFYPSDFEHTHTFLVLEGASEVSTLISLFSIVICKETLALSTFSLFFWFAKRSCH
ncbi:hypothetical protein LguiA_005667 [Lonicera macranthoides]